MQHLCYMKHLCCHASQKRGRVNRCPLSARRCLRESCTTRSIPSWPPLANAHATSARLERDARGGAGGAPARFSPSCSAAAATPSGCSRRSSATTATNIELGERVFFNFNCVVLDVCPVQIGDFSLFGPAVQIYTATHPMNAALRRQQEFGKPIEIGSDVWVGGGAIILPGVTIGSRRGDRRRKRGHTRHSRRVFAAGNPCRVIREITE